MPFPHLVFHLVLTYSNVEAVRLCFSESFEALVEGLESCLWQLGGVPRQHRTDHLSAAIARWTPTARPSARERYARADAPLRDGADDQQRRASRTRTATSSRRTTASSRRVDQALRVRGSRDFADRAAYERFLQSSSAGATSPGSALGRGAGGAAPAAGRAAGLRAASCGCRSAASAPSRCCATPTRCRRG